MYAGGLLFRLVADNFYNLVETSLDDLGWFAANRNHLPVAMRPTPVEDDELVKPNVVAFSEEDINDNDIEMGTNLSEHRFTYYIDIYAESKAVGLHLSGDIKDILQGRFTSIGRTTPNFPVLDLTQATPTEIIFCEIENVFVDRSRFFDKPYQRFWWVVGCELVFSYMNDVY